MEKFNGKDFEIARVGLGCMRMSVSPTSNRKESIATIQAALDSGINLLNTGDFYGIGGHNEKLVGEAVKGCRRDQAFISLKYGKFNPLRGGMDVGPKHVKKNIKTSLTRLGLDYVDLYQPARIDIGIPLEDTIGAIKDLIDEGCVRYLGVSEVEEDILRRVNAIHPVALVESEVSFTNNEIDDDIIPAAEELGIGIVGFGVLSFGKLFKNDDDPLIRAISSIAKEKRASVSQIAHAWVLRKSDNMIPLIGSRKTERMKDSIGCLDIYFTEEDYKRIQNAMATSSIMGRAMPKLVVKNGKMVR